MTAEAIELNAIEIQSQTEQARVYREWAWNNPVSWCRVCLGLDLWSKQREIIKSVRKHRRTSCRSCHSVGKTVVAAATALWYLNAVCPSKVVTTSTTWENLKSVYWSTVHELVRNAPYDVTLGGALLDTRMEIMEGWGMYALSPNKPEAFGGYHSPNGVLVLVDEASALESEHADAIGGIITTPISRVLYIGNPTRPEGEYFETFRRPGWNNIHISAFDCPNVKAGKNIVPGLASREWIDTQSQEWGEESPQYLVRIKGEFPESGENVLIPPAWAEGVKASGALPSVDKDTLRLGVDVARYGSDKTVFLLRDKNAVREVETFQGQDTMRTAGQIVAAIKRHNLDPLQVYIDDVGVGGGVVDRLKEQDYMVRGVNAGDKADDSETFANKRAEMYWRLRMAMRPESDCRIAVPQQYKQLLRECTLTHYGYTSSGKLKIESKDDIKKRLGGQSPDEADALALTYAWKEYSSVGIMAL